MLDEREGEAPADQRHLAFNPQPLRARAAIVAAGPVANLVLAISLLAIVNWMGMQEPVARLATPPAGTVLQMAGVQGGDRVLRIALGDQEWEEVRSINDLRWTLTRAALDDESVRMEVLQGRRTAPSELRLALAGQRSEEHTSELQSPCNLVCRLLLEKKKIHTVTVLRITVNSCKPEPLPS